MAGFFALSLVAAPAGAEDEVSLRLGGNEIAVSPLLAERLAALAREIVQRCGPNTLEHPLAVSEVVVGLDGGELFVGPDFTRYRGVVAEHLNCGYLASLELACLPELAPYLPARYRETCAKLERRVGPHRHAAARHRALVQLARFW